VTPRVLARVGFALGGPTYILARPDRRVVLRCAFDEHELAVDASGIDEPLGVLLRGGDRVVVTPSAARGTRRIAYNAQRPDGERLFHYERERATWDGADCAVWRIDYPEKTP